MKLRYLAWNTGKALLIIFYLPCSEGDGSFYAQ